MRSIDDYKMVLHNSAIVINNCNATDFPTLTNRFNVYDPVRHKSDPIGIYYDSINRRIFLPRGLDVDFVRRKVSSAIGMEDFTSTIVHNHKFDHVPRKVSLKLPPRDEVQIEALKFALCKDKYEKYGGRSQFALSLVPGKGKTYIASCVFSYLGIKSIVITAQSGILDQWRDRLKEYTDIQDSEIVKIEGSHMINRILAGNSNFANKSLYLCTHSTLHSYASNHGWESIGELFRVLGIGIKFFDEAHQNFNNMALIDFAARDVYRTYYITATPSRSDRQEDHIYKLYMKNVPSIDLFNVDIDAHTNYVAIKYNSYPKPADVNSCKTSVYGINNPAYIAYLMRNERFWVMFDYIFSMVYRNGGRCLFYIGTNYGIKKVFERIIYNYPELVNDIGIYSSISEDKQLAKTKRFILTTTKSAGAGEDIAHLKYSVVLAEPFKSEVLARQTLGRTRDPNTTYIELVDVGFKQLISYFNSKRQVFSKYASSVKVMTVDNPRLVSIDEENRNNILTRFNKALELNASKDAITFTDNKNTPAVWFGDNSLNELNN